MKSTLQVVFQFLLELLSWDNYIQMANGFLIYFAFIDYFFSCIFFTIYKKSKFMTISLQVFTGLCLLLPFIYGLVNLLLSFLTFFMLNLCRATNLFESIGLIAACPIATNCILS